MITKFCSKAVLTCIFAASIVCPLSACSASAPNESTTASQGTTSSVSNNSAENSSTANNSVGNSSATNSQSGAENNHGGILEEDNSENNLQMKINDVGVNVVWEENEAVSALKNVCKDAPLEIQMSMYGGFEQVGPLGATLPSNDEQMTTSAGDIVLYSGNQIVVFYGSNSWRYTKLGRITDRDAQGMSALLSNGDVKITITSARSFESLI